MWVILHGIKDSAQTIAIRSIREWQEPPRTWSWWQLVAPLLPVAATAFNLQAELPGPGLQRGGDEASWSGYGGCFVSQPTTKEA